MVNAKVGQIVYYMLPAGGYAPMIVTSVQEGSLSGYVFNLDGSGTTYVTATYGGRVWPAIGDLKPGTWFHPFPVL